MVKYDGSNRGRLAWLPREKDYHLESWKATTGYIVGSKGTSWTAVAHFEWAFRSLRKGEDIKSSIDWFGSGVVCFRKRNLCAWGLLPPPVTIRWRWTFCSQIPPLRGRLGWLGSPRTDDQDRIERHYGRNGSRRQNLSCLPPKVTDTPNEGMLDDTVNSSRLGTYVRNSLWNNASPISPDLVKNPRKIKDKHDFWNMLQNCWRFIPMEKWLGILKLGEWRMVDSGRLREWEWRCGL